jgi:hypothetical protein
MNNYEPDIFYNTRELSIEQKIDILKYAYEICDRWHVDTLDCNISWARQEIEMPFDEILQKLSPISHFTFIHRRGFRNSKGEPVNDNEYVIEIGFCTMKDPEYFLWIYCNENKLSKLLTKFTFLKKRLP